MKNTDDQRKTEKNQTDQLLDISLTDKSWNNYRAHTQTGLLANIQGQCNSINMFFMHKCIVKPNCPNSEDGYNKYF